MKNSVNKGFFTYLILFIVMALGVVLVAGFIMMFTPGTNILGYVFTRDKSHVNIITYEGLDNKKIIGSKVVVLDNEGKEKPLNEESPKINFTSITKLIIKTNGMPVDLIYSNEQDKIDVKRDVSGFSKAEDVEELTITKHFKEGVLTITALDKNPMLKLSNKSRIIVYFKQQPKNLNLEIETKTSGLSVATSSFDQATPRDISLNSVKFTTQSGNLVVSKVGKILNSLEVTTTKKSSIEIGANLGEEAQLENVLFNVAEGEVQTKNINAKNFSLEGKSAFVNLGDVSVNQGGGKLNFALKNGDFKTGTFNGSINDEDSLVENVSFYIKKITGNFTLGQTDIQKANRANVYIDEVGGNVSIRTSTGDVKIKSAAKHTIIESFSGSIYYKAAADTSDKFDFKTSSGNINLILDNIYAINNDLNLATSDKGNIVVYYKNSLDSFTITATAKGNISFPVDNFSQKNKTVIGYPSPHAPQPEFEHRVKFNINTNSNITVTAVQETPWSLIG